MRGVYVVGGFSVAARADFMGTPSRVWYGLCQLMSLAGFYIVSMCFMSTVLHLLSRFFFDLQE